MEKMDFKKKKQNLRVNENLHDLYIIKKHRRCLDFTYLVAHVHMYVHGAKLWHINKVTIAVVHVANHINPSSGLSEFLFFFRKLLKL